MTATAKLGFVVGLAAEARIAARSGFPARVGGGTPAGAAIAAEALLAAGVEALVSFGLAGGLDPALRPGTVVIPVCVLSDGQRFATDASLADRFGGSTGHVVLGASEIVDSVAAKRQAARRSGAGAVDLESGAVAGVAAAKGVPFAVVRAICDPAERPLPPAALVALTPRGGIGLPRVFGSLLRHPRQVGGLRALARDAAAGRGALLRLVEGMSQS